MPVKRFFVGTMLFAAVVSPAAPRSIETNDGIQPAACESAVLSKLHAQVVRIAGTRNPDDAWLLVRTLLCGTGKSAGTIVTAHVQGTVKNVTDAEDADPPTELHVDDKQLKSGYFRGRGWGPEVYDADGAMRVSAWTGRLCWSRFSLEFAGPKWRLVEIGGGCD